MVSVKLQLSFTVLTTDSFFAHRLWASTSKLLGEGGRLLNICSEQTEHSPREQHCKANADLYLRS